MSWFPDDEILTDERPSRAVGDGVLLERRSVLRLSAATLAAALASCAAASKEAPSSGTSTPPEEPPPPLEGESLDVARFLAEMSPRAQHFIASGGRREEAYLMAVGELMARLETPTRAEAREATIGHLRRRRDAGQPRDVVVAMFALDPGKGFSHHDHRDYNGVILGVEGEAHVRNYDILGDDPVPPEGEVFRIRQTRDDLILPGRFSTLGTSRDNVHELIAGPEGATVLDVFTFMNEEATSYFMDVDPEPRDADQRIFDATWA